MEDGVGRGASDGWQVGTGGEAGIGGGRRLWGCSSPHSRGMEVRERKALAAGQG